MTTVQKTIPIPAETPGATAVRSEPRVKVSEKQPPSATPSASISAILAAARGVERIGLFILRVTPISRLLSPAP